MPRERALRVYLDNPRLARETGWAALWGLETPFSAKGYQEALSALLGAAHAAEDAFAELLTQARARAAPRFSGPTCA